MRCQCKVLLALLKVHFSLPWKVGILHLEQFSPLTEAKEFSLASITSIVHSKENQYFPDEFCSFSIYHLSKAVQELIPLSDLRKAASTSDSL